jgi:hypothetical protein
MNKNTTMQLWEIQGFESSSVRALFVGQTANGQDCIGCAWDAFTTYIFAYEGIIDTFMYYMERYNSVGKAMAFTKLKDGMEERLYFSPYASGRKLQNHNQLYVLRRYEMKSAMTAHIVVHQDLWNETPENAIKRLVNDEVLSGEQSHFVACMTNRVTA